MTERGATLIDDRVVLPLSKARHVATDWCRAHCHRGEHRPACLIPTLQARDQTLGEQPQLLEVSPDCTVGGVKCQACTGCACDCHRHHNRPQTVVPSPS